MHCAKCGFENPEEMNFCGKCGFPLSSAGSNLQVNHNDLSNRISVKEGESRFRKMAEMLPSGIVEMDADLNLAFVNKAAFVMLGYTEQDLTIKLNAFQLIHPDDRKKAYERLAVYRTGEYVPPTEYRLLKKDGTEFPTLIKSEPVFDDNEICGYLVSITDSSRLKEVETALRESEEKLEMVMDGVLTPIVYINSDLQYEFVNKPYTDWYKKRKKDIEGKFIHDILAKDVFERALPSYRAALEGKQVYFENLTERDGEEKYVGVSLVPHYHSEKVVGFFASINDVTDRKRAEQDRDRIIKELEEAISQIRQLSGLLPICSNCKKIRDDKGYWNQIESYIEQRSEAQFSHGICEECAEKIYGDSKWFKKRKGKK